MKAKWVKLLAVLACLTLATGVAACGGKDDGGNSSSGSSLSEGSSSVEDGSSEVVDSSSEVVEDDSSEEAIDSSSEDSSVEDEFYTEGLAFTLQDDDTYSVIYYMGAATEVVIPSVYNGKEVTSIDDYAFMGCQNLTRVSFGENSRLTSIGSLAFYYCNSLTEIVIPDSVTSIGEGAFEECDSLQYTMKGGLKYLGNSNNPYIYLLRTKTTGITSATIESGCRFIGDDAFKDCESLTEIVIPDSVTSIGDGAFSGCSGLKEVVIPNSVTSIGSYAFGYCDSLQYTIKGGLKYLGNLNNPYRCLVDTESTENTSATIENGCEVIANGVFAYGYNLTEIVIPDSVTSIGNKSFDFCYNLTNITVDENNTEYKSVDGNLYSKDEKTLIRYAKGKTATSFTIPDSVTNIGCYAFTGCNNLTEIVIPDSVMSIDDWAFYSCTSLKEIGIPDSVMGIGCYAFSFCFDLTEIVIPDSVTYVGAAVFVESADLIILCEAESQPSRWHAYWNADFHPVFYNCRGLQSTIKDGLKYLGNSSNPYRYLATTETDDITSATIENGCEIIANRAFSNCSNLTEIVIPASVKSIEVAVFMDCSYLSEVVIPDSVTSIGFDAFYGCNYLTIYCEAESQKSGWDKDWNRDNHPVVWGYKGE